MIFFHGALTGLLRAKEEKKQIIPDCAHEFFSLDWSLMRSYINTQTVETHADNTLHPRKSKQRIRFFGETTKTGIF